MLSLKKLKWAFSLCLLSFQPLCAGFLPFHSTIVAPTQFIVHLESVAWINDSGERLDLLKAPMAFDAMGPNSVNLRETFDYAVKIGFIPKAFEIRTKRYYDVEAEGELINDEGIATRVHTQANLPAIAMAGINNITLAAGDAKEVGLQRCYFPQSADIDSRLIEGGLSEAKEEELVYRAEVLSSWFDTNDDLNLIVKCSGVEFGDSLFGAPYFIVPYLPTFELLTFGSQDDLSSI